MKKVFGTIMALGFIFALGTAGASDCNTIPETQVYVQLAIAAAAMLGGYIGIYIIERREIAKGNIYNKVICWGPYEQKEKRPRLD